jgi:hypothetical protein
VLYPWLVAQFRNRAWPIFPWDRPLAALLPPLLETLSQPIGSPIVLSGGGMPGPTVVLAMGVLLAGLVYAVPFVRRRLRAGGRWPWEGSTSPGRRRPDGS